MLSNNYFTVQLQKHKSVLEIMLNRPDIHNAFDDKMISELTQIFTNIASNRDIRAVVITGNGKSFCAGADLNWMRKMKDYNFQENIQDSQHLSEMFEKLYRLPIPTIAKINGAAIGGGVGLVAACDIAIAANSAIFSLSEARLGLVPACISPYLLKHIPSGRLAPYFLTGMRMDSQKAKEIGLIHEVVSDAELNQTVDKLLENILLCGPQALKMAKDLLANVPQMTSKEYMPYTAEMIAKLRVSDEGQEGLSAFLEKRKPKWHETKE